MSRVQVTGARRRLSREQGTVFKDWGGRLPIALIYPNSYRVGMSSLGFQTIYGLLNSCSRIVCERAFWEVRKGQGPPLSLESQRPLADFAVLAFSVSYELDYFNVVGVLRAAGIPLFAAERDEQHPLVIGGGPCIIANPQPLAPFFDCLAVGEGEVILPPMLEALLEGIEGSRDELLRALASVPGVYVPRLSNSPVVRQWARNLDDFDTTSVVLTRDTELGDMYLMEIERGCGRGCRFCLAGFAFRPVRFRSVERLVGAAGSGLESRKRLGLVGAAVLDHPHIEELVERLRGMGAELSFSSLRVDALSEGIAKALAESGTRTIALAPEAGSDRLRRIIRKGISEDEVLRAVDRVARVGLRQIKLYLMIGLPGERDEDIGEMVRLILACQALAQKKQPGLRITANVTPFVPKAGTPFQWLDMTRPEVLDHRLGLLRRSLRPKGIELKAESVAWSQVQGVLARGDERLAQVLARMEQNSLPAWRQAMEECQLSADLYAHRRWRMEERLPWAVVEGGTRAEYLQQELKTALSYTP